MTGQDIFVNAAGGVRIGEPAADLGMVVALASSFLDKAIDPQTMVVGEVGLAGEIRGVTQPELRVREAAKLGFKRCILPATNIRQMKVSGIDVVGVRTVEEALEQLFP
jgi:DNA repair protein RadA/Sms